MIYDLVIKNGTIITASASVKADVAVTGERIAAVGPDLTGRESIDAAGMLVTPGAVDIHVHFEAPMGKITSSDDFFQGTRAAAFGGTTTIVDFVESGTEERFEDALAGRREIADAKAAVDYGLHMTIGPNDMGKLGQIPELREKGIRSFKLYMAYALRLHDGQLLDALTAIRDAECLPVIHAENWDVIQSLTARNIRDGNISPRWHPASRPDIFEAEAVGRVVTMARYTGVPVHIFHISCALAAEKIAAARAAGIKVTGETCPQYLFLTQEVYKKPGVEGALPVCAPPLRPDADRKYLWKVLGAGGLQAVSSDHCPFTKKEKAAGLDRFDHIPGGVPSAEIRFPSIYSGGVRTGLLTPQQWIDLCCTMPANLLGYERKGDIGVGKDADIVIFNPEKRIRISPESLHETAGWTPYEGLVITGWPEKTISRGRVITDGGSFLGVPGGGRYIGFSE